MEPNLEQVKAKGVTAQVPRAGPCWRAPHIVVYAESRPLSTLPASLPHQSSCSWQSSARAGQHAPRRSSRFGAAAARGNLFARVFAPIIWLAQVPTWLGAPGCSRRDRHDWWELNSKESMQLRTNIAQIRALIAQGKTDAEIAAQLIQMDDEGQIADWSSVDAMLGLLVKTMRRCAKEDWPVAAPELLGLLDFFRALWEEVVASGDLHLVNAPVLDAFKEVQEGDGVSAIYQALRADAELLSAPVGNDPSSRDRRRSAELRYRKLVDGVPVICMARVSEVVARANFVLFSAVQHLPHYQPLFSEPKLHALVPLVAVQRQSWSELLKQSAALVDPHQFS